MSFRASGDEFFGIQKAERNHPDPSSSVGHSGRGADGVLFVLEPGETSGGEPVSGLARRRDSGHARNDLRPERNQTGMDGTESRPDSFKTRSETGTVHTTLCRARGNF